MAYVGGPAAVSSVPVSKVELRIQCHNLLDKDVTSKSDPCAVLMMKTSKGRWYEVGRTENIKNCLNPQFTRTFEMDYYFEEVQNLYIGVYDLDNKTPELDDDDYLGGIECTMGQVVSGSPFVKGLVKRNGAAAGKGKITVYAEELPGSNDLLQLSFRAEHLEKKITAEELQGSNDLLQLSFRAEHLDKKDFLGKSDPFLEFSREVGTGNWQVVHRTEVIKNNLNPTWKTFEVPVQKLCRGNQDLPIKITCMDMDEDSSHDLIGSFTTSVMEMRKAVDEAVDCHDYDNDGSHDFIGSFSTTVNELMKAVDTQLKWPAINPKKKAKKKGYKDSGIIHLTSCKVMKQYSFLEFVFGGMQINFTVGIDFTASNGDPRSPQSLHYINPYQPNEYMKAIQSVGAVVQDYDSDKMFPALGFGARIPPHMQVSHEFAVNFNMQNPFCAGVQGIVQAYQHCISQVQLYGPTNFSPIIHHVAKFAAAAQREEGAQNYFVLLILTDGVISDMNETRQAIVYASQLPMSLIIVGVGGADFTAMNVLDGDDGVLRAPSGERVRRDIVQFVPFREFVNAPPAELAKHVLAEVPKQVTDYYKLMGIAPNPRPAAPPVQ